MTTGRPADTLTPSRRRRHPLVRFVFARLTDAAVLGTLALLGAQILSSSCESGARGTDAAHDGNAAATDALLREVLANEGENIVLPAYRALASALADLELATASLAEDPSDAHLAAARAAFETVMDRSARADVLLVGPAATIGTSPEAEGLRDELQSWPLVNTCRVDQTIVSGGFEPAEALGTLGLNVRGLPAIEYLLYAPSTDTVCPPTTSIVSDGSYAALGAAEITARRARYAHAATTLARGRADEIVARWEGGFLERLRTAGAGSATFATALAGLNALSDALFYVEQPLLDAKLGTPAGLYACTASSCPEQVEAPWRDRAAEDGGEGGSLRAVRVSLEAFRDAYSGLHDGLDGPGFDDVLAFLGADELDGRIREALDASLAAIGAIEGPLDDAVVLRNDEVRAAVEALRTLTALLGGEFVTTLQLALPARVDGDND